MGRFDVGMISTDGGEVLLVEVEWRSRKIERFAEQFVDHPDPGATEHSVRDLVFTIL